MKATAGVPVPESPGVVSVTAMSRALLEPGLRLTMIPTPGMGLLEGGPNLVAAQSVVCSVAYKTCALSYVIVMVLHVPSKVTVKTFGFAFAEVFNATNATKPIIVS